MKGFKLCPSTLAEGFDTYSPKALRLLFGGHKVSPILDFDVDRFQDVSEIINAMQRFSVTGEQEKFSAVIEAGKIRLSRDGEQSTHILKPVPWNESLQARKQLPANEHLTMQIASQVYGLPTAANALCLTSYGQPVYITRRFDILPDGTKLQTEDFASVIGRNEVSDGPNFKHSGSYEDVASAIRTYVAAWRIDMERFFDLIVFNYIYGNGDSHLKNFSLIRYGQDYRLAPAYDLLNTGLHMRTADFGLDGGLSPNIEKSEVYEKSGHPCRIDFERFGECIGIISPRLTRILDKYTEIPAAAQTLISRSFLSDKTKRSYLRSLTDRTARFTRLSLN